jgi:carboxyl-terminal processing protease
MKITIQKFFRINGGSTQLRGVTPDVIIPGIYSYRDIGEKEEEFPMKWDEIDEVYYKKQYIKKYDKIIKRSNKRIAENKIFKNIDKQAKWYKELQENTEVLLNLEEYKLQQKSLDEKSKSFENKNKDLEFFEVEMTNADKFAFESDSIRLKSFNDWHKQVKKDPYIDEAVQIIMDWL